MPTLSPARRGSLTPPQSICGQTGEGYGYDVFVLICQPSYLRDSEKPNRTLDQMDLESLWRCWDSGEAKLDATNEATGMKPPLCMAKKRDAAAGNVERRRWARKSWQRFREIPEHIDARVGEHAVSPAAIIKDLEKTRTTATGSKMGLNKLSLYLKSLREKAATTTTSPLSDMTLPTPSPSTAANETTTNEDGLEPDSSTSPGLGPTAIHTAQKRRAPPLASVQNERRFARP
ncbi:hypothetical protein OG21DRAFT_1489421 [Imleria badia]|nr:hypothetical protein OG21DRAFT_1489421 [Imleria badia]